MRINIYKQIRGFYSLVFNSEYEFRPTHISLYMFLLNQNNRSNWVEWFKCPFDTVMMGACINSNKTYYKTLNELQNYKLIKYEKGINNYKAPKINIIPLDCNDLDIPDIPTPEQSSSVIFTRVNTLLNTQLGTQLSTRQITQLDKQLSTQLSEHKDILITNNFKLTIEIQKEEKKTYPKEVRTILNNTSKLFPNDVIKKLTEDIKLQWMDTIDKLHRIDGYDYEMIENVIKFGRTNDFWKGVFLSVATLRDKGKSGTVKFIMMKTKMEINNTHNNKPELTTKKNYKERLC